MKIAIFAAGTGGHIFPALSIAEEFKKDDVIFFASNRELEKQIYQKTGYKVIHINILKMILIFFFKAMQYKKRFLNSRRINY